MAAPVQLYTPVPSSESFVISDPTKGTTPAHTGYGENIVKSEAKPDDNSAHPASSFIHTNLSSRQRRYFLLSMFILVELLWIGFGVYAGMKTARISVPSDGFYTFFNSYNIPSKQVSQSTLSFLAGIYQSAALIFPGNLLAEAYANEWYHRLHGAQANDKAGIDSVSVLTSGPIDRARYFYKKRRDVSRVFPLAFVASILLIPLHNMMHSMITLGPAEIENKDFNLTLGALPSIDFNTEDQNARDLQLAARDAYVSQVIHGFLDIVSSFSSGRARRGNHDS